MNDIIQIMLLKQKEQLKRDLPPLLKEHYNIQPDLVDILAWGYQSVAFYIEANNQRYTARTDVNTPENKEKTEKEIYLSNLLHQKIPTSEYIKNTQNSSLTLVDHKLLRLSKYIEGTAPFKMNMDVFEQAIKLLHQIHLQDLTGENMNTKLLHRINNPNKDGLFYLLHGDLAPSNIIVADNKIVGILDFADAALGPVEWDLAHTCVFSWFRMHDYTFDEIIKKGLETYNTPLDLKLLYKYCVEQIENHLKMIITNKDKYDNEEFWQDDYDFTKKCLVEIKKL